LVRDLVGLYFVGPSLYDYIPLDKRLHAALAVLEVLQLMCNVVPVDV